MKQKHRGVPLNSRVGREGALASRIDPAEKTSMIRRKSADRYSLEHTLSATVTSTPGLHRQLAARFSALHVRRCQQARRLWQAIHREIGLLPQVQAAPLILSLLQGQSIEKVAAELGWDPSEVRGELEQGQRVLTRRLAAHGFTLFPGQLLALLRQEARQEALPAERLQLLVRSSFTADADLPVPVARLVADAMNSMAEGGV